MKRAATWSTIRHVAHRCGGRLAPENTLAGLDLAAKRGYAAVEFDVMLSAEATPFVIHDESLERTTDGRGDVAAQGDASLRAVRANRGYEATFPDARIPCLDEMLEACRQRALAMNVEIKPAAGHDVATARRTAEALRARCMAGADSTVLVSSFSETALAVARELLPDLPFALLVEQVPADWLQRAQAYGCAALHVSRRQERWDWLAAAHAHGLAVRCYTVNDPATARELFALGVDAIFTDALDLFPGDLAATNRYTR